MFGVAVAVQQDDGDRVKAVAAQTSERGSGGFFVERSQYLSIGADPLIDLDDLVVEHVGQHDVEREQVRARLVTDAQCIAEPGRCDERSASALALKQRVGRHGRAHADRIDLTRGQRIVRTQAQQCSDPSDGRVVVVARVLRQQLVGHHLAIRASGNDVGEGAASIDPELPAGH